MFLHWVKHNDPKLPLPESSNLTRRGWSRGASPPSLHHFPRLRRENKPPLAACRSIDCSHQDWWGVIPRLLYTPLHILKMNQPTMKLVMVARQTSMQCFRGPPSSIPPPYWVRYMLNPPPGVPIWEHTHHEDSLHLTGKPWGFTKSTDIDSMSHSQKKNSMHCCLEEHGTYSRVGILHT